MVVAHSDPSTSALKKKTRRKMSKKTAAVSSSQTQDEDMIDDDAAGLDLDLDLDKVTLEPLDHVQTTGEIEEEDDLLVIDDDPANLPTTTSSAPYFPPLTAAQLQSASGLKKSETRSIPIPPHRMTPLKNDWISMFGPLTEMMGLQVRMNVARRCVEVRVR